MSQPKKAITESSIARMAGNIAAGLVSGRSDADLTGSGYKIARLSVDLALMIAEEIEQRRQSAETETP